MKNTSKKFYIALWMLMLVILGSYYLFFAPRNSEFSEAENRTLEGFPQITAQSLFSGEFGQAFESYLLDHFPGRNTVISAVNQMKSNLSFASYEEYLLLGEDVVDNLSQDDYQDALDSLLAELDSTPEMVETSIPADDVPSSQPEEDSQETVPAEYPPIVEKPEASAEDFPAYTGIYMDTGKGAYITDKYYRDNVVAGTAILNKYASLLPENGKLMFTLGPSANRVSRFVSSKEKVSFYSDWDDLVNALGNDNVYAFDAPEILCKEILEGKYVSFRTDNHWTPYGAYQVYRQMAAQAGKELCSYTEDFTITVEENFLGTYFRTDPDIYSKVDSDTLEILMPKIGVEYRKVTGPDTYEVVDFLDMDAQFNDRYAVYLGGPSGPWHYVECDNGETENCLVVSDSFGLTVIPFLTYNYKQVHYYDARYFDKDAIGHNVAEMIEKYNIHDIYVIIAEMNSFNSSFLLVNVNQHLNMK